MPIIPLINFAKGASRTGSVSHTGKNFGKVCTPKSDASEGAKGNEDFQKETKRFFDEKRL